MTLPVVLMLRNYHFSPMKQSKGLDIGTTVERVNEGAVEMGQ